EIGAEPDQLTGKARSLRGERQQDGNAAVHVAAGDDRRMNVFEDSDVPLPGREPGEGLKNGTVRALFEFAPFARQSGEIALDCEGEIATMRDGFGSGRLR